jgi:hypothetical protein
MSSMTKRGAGGFKSIDEILPVIGLPQPVTPLAGDLAPSLAIDPRDLTAKDITYTHAVFAQCFLPARPLKKGILRHQVNHGNAALIVRAGELIDPKKTHEMEVREVPAGAKARLLLSYINDRAVRTGSADIDMGKSLREFMGKAGIPIGGPNGREITRQVKNIAACQMVLGVWGEHQAAQKKIDISDGISFWLEKDSKQQTLWQPMMTLSDDYMAALEHHRVPIDFRGLVELQESPRAMDIFVWLSYRLCRIPRGKPVLIPYKALQPIFGTVRRRPNQFRDDFQGYVTNIVKRCYPEARLSLESDYIRLYYSPSPVPAANTVQLPRRL